MKWFANFFKKLLKAIKKILAIVLIIIAVILLVMATIATGGTALVVFGFAISTTAAYVLAALAVTAAFLIDPETSKEVVGKVGDAVKDATSSIGNAVGSVVGGGLGGLVGGLFESPWGLVIAGVGLWWLLRDDGNEKRVATRDSARVDEKTTVAVKGSRASATLPQPSSGGRNVKPGDLSGILEV